MVFSPPASGTTPHTESSGVKPAPARGIRKVPKEGDDGIFSECWFALCLDEEITRGKVHGMPFLDGRVIAYRDTSGQVLVRSAYCAHLGTDLSTASMEGDEVVCNFHYWRYGTEGSCTATGVGDRVPPNARLFAFPVQVMYGIVFVFNGSEPLYDLPTFPVSDDKLVYRAMRGGEPLPMDPMVAAAQTPDLAHLSVLHGFDCANDIYADIVWRDHSFTTHVDAMIPSKHHFDVDGSIYGTNYFFQSGTIDGRWFGWASPMGIPTPGHTQLFLIVAAARQEGESEEELQKFLDEILAIENEVLSEDLPILEGMHFGPRSLTRADRALSRFFEYLRRYPRSHQAADYIN